MGEKRNSLAGSLQSIVHLTPLVKLSMGGSWKKLRANAPVRHFGVQTIKFDDVECSPSNSRIWNANGQIQRFGQQTIRCDDLESRPSNSTIGSADRQIRRFGVQTLQFDELEYRP